MLQYDWEFCRHIVVELQLTLEKEKIVKAAREKRHIIYKRTQLTALMRDI